MKLVIRNAPRSLVVPTIALLAFSGSACAERVEAAPAATATACAEPPTVVHELDEEAVGVTTHPPVRRAPPEFDDSDPDAIRLFHDVLAPFGTWTDDPRLGLVWFPSRDVVGASFVPYGTHGHWTYREVAVVNGAAQAAPRPEYIWVSDLPWGWVAFHYGRWAYTGEGGWAWVAGRRYAGAWVDWRAPRTSADAILGWGPMPPAHVWRISPGPMATRAWTYDGAFDPHEEHPEAVPYAAFSTPYSYVRSRDLFAPDLGGKLLPAASALAVAYTTDPSAAPTPGRLGFRDQDVPAPPLMDRGLQQAWMLATPATASAVGAGPELAAPPRLRTWVAGGVRYAVAR